MAQHINSNDARFVVMERVNCFDFRNHIRTCHSERFDGIHRAMITSVDDYIETTQTSEVLKTLEVWALVCKKRAQPLLPRWQFNIQYGRGGEIFERAVGG